MSEVKAKKDVVKNVRWQRDKDREKVKGIFKFLEVPGGSLSFVYKAYKEDPVERFDLVDGEIYTLPLGVARHLNKNGWYPEYVYIANEKETQSAIPAAMGGGSVPSTMRIGRKVQRFMFTSLEFVDIEDLNPSPLVTVEQV